MAASAASRSAATADVGVGRRRDHHHPVAAAPVPVEPTPHLGSDVGGQVARRRTPPPTSSKSVGVDPGEHPGEELLLGLVGHLAAGQRGLGEPGGELRQRPAARRRGRPRRSGSRTRFPRWSGCRRSRRRRRRSCRPAAQAPGPATVARPGRHRRRTGWPPRAPRPSARLSSPSRVSTASASSDRQVPLGQRPSAGRCAGRPGGARRARRPRPRRPRAPCRSAPPGWPGPWRAPRRLPTARPVRIRSRARPSPTRRGSRTVPPSTRGTPKRRQNTPNTASSAATRRSHQTASSSPPATAWPSTAAMTGFDEGEAGRPHRSRAVLGDPVAGPRGDGLEVGPGAERPRGPGQHGHGGARRRRRTPRRRRAGRRPSDGPRRCGVGDGRWSRRSPVRGGPRGRREAGGSSWPQHGRWRTARPVPHVTGCRPVPRSASATGPVKPDGSGRQLVADPARVSGGRPGADSVEHRSDGPGRGRRRPTCGAHRRHASQRTRHRRTTTARSSTWPSDWATRPPTSPPTRPKARSTSTSTSGTAGACSSPTRRTSRRSARPSSAPSPPPRRSSTSATPSSSACRSTTSPPTASGPATSRRPRARPSTSRSSGTRTARSPTSTT